MNDITIRFITLSELLYMLRNHKYETEVFFVSGVGETECIAYTTDSENEVFINLDTFWNADFNQDDIDKIKAGFKNE